MPGENRTSPENLKFIHRSTLRFLKFLNLTVHVLIHFVAKVDVQIHSTSTHTKMKSFVISAGSLGICHSV
jgi:hypothetical protein